MHPRWGFSPRRVATDLPTVGTTRAPALAPDLVQAVLDGVRAGAAVVDASGQLVATNSAARSILGLDPAAAGPADWPRHCAIHGPDGAALRCDALAAASASAGETALAVHDTARPGGVLVRATARPLAAGGRRYAVVVFEDEQPASSEQLRTLLDCASDYAVFMLDPGGAVASWSASAERLVGYPAAEVLGRPYDMFFTPAAVAAGEPARALAEATGGSVAVEGERVRRDGSEFWANGTLTPVRYHDGTVRGFVKVIHDGTEQRRSEARFRGLLDAAPDAMIGVDGPGRIVFANAQAERLFGYPRAELLGRPVELLLPEARRGVHVRHREKYLARPSTRPMGGGLELTALCRDGSEFPVEVSLSTLVAEEGMIVSAGIRDIGDRLRSQRAIEDLNAELRRANDELEGRVAARTAELAAQAAELRTAYEELEAFSYSVSHDLRSPVRAMDGFAMVLARRHADQLDEAGQHYLGRLRAGAKQMGQLIDGLLAFSRLQRQAMTNQQVDMGALVRDVWYELAPDRAGRKVDLVMGELPPAEGDARLLRHVLSNLLTNSLKYTRTRPRAVVTVGVHAEEPGTVSYFVRDNGVGFDMRYSDKLFQVFQRMHRAEDYEGTGIGLALAGRIVHRHGGRIWAEAEPDVGATFYFSLPLRRG
jgi:PAS domain S-box-containing protein